MLRWCPRDTQNQNVKENQPLSLWIKKKDYEQDLELKTDGKPIWCSKSQIKFISPRIATLIKTDPTISCFKFKTKNSSLFSGILHDMFNELLIEVPEELPMTFNQIVNEKLHINEIIENLTIENDVESL